MTEPIEPISPLSQPAHQASSPFHGPDAANGATSTSATADDRSTESMLTLHAVEEIQTAVGVLQIQMAIALALALLSLSILTYSLKQGPG
jgi:hypothetical protein